MTRSPLPPEQSTPYGDKLGLLSHFHIASRPADVYPLLYLGLFHVVKCGQNAVLTTHIPSIFVITTECPFYIAPEPQHGSFIA